MFRISKRNEGPQAQTVAVAGVVLASGTSTRFGSENKLLVEFEGKPIVRRTALAYVGARLQPVVVVVGNDRERVVRALSGLNVTFVENAEFAEGQSRALRHGIAALPDAASAAVIGVGDQPLLAAEVIDSLADAYWASGARIVVPRYGGQRGNPALFAAELFDELRLVDGDQGGRALIEPHRDEVVWVDVPNPELGEDVDTPDDLDRLARGADRDTSA